jgi:hypothetical protein
MSYANPIDTRIVEVVLDDLQDNNHHTLCELLAKAYGIEWGSIPESVTEDAYQAAHVSYMSTVRRSTVYATWVKGEN